MLLGISIPTVADIDGHYAKTTSFKRPRRKFLHGLGNTRKYSSNPNALDLRLCGKLSILYVYSHRCVCFTLLYAVIL